jgi:formate dehydrogenase
MNVQNPPRPPGNGAEPTGRGRNRPRRTPKGRQIDPQAASEIAALLGDRSRQRDLLIEHLHLIQDKYGHISSAHMAALAAEMKLSMTEVYEVATFYAHFDVVKEGQTSPPPVTVRVCDSLSCAMAGADRLLTDLPNTLGPNVRVVRAPCMGACDHAPVCAVGHVQVNNATGASVKKFAYPTTHAHAIHPGTDFEHYMAAGGYRVLAEAFTGKRTREDLIKIVSDSGLRGLGGAGFPTGRKWKFVRMAKGDKKYIICNADESEPGTFKDRILLLDDPHRTIEGMCIAAYAIGATKGYLYIRGEYPYIVPVLENALNEAREAGLLGNNILNSGFSFDIEIRVGAGAYICGEETALFESIEGKRGFPRIKPPFPTTYGVFGKPTVINNVETLCNVPLIISQGVAEFRKIGTEKSPGPKLFCVSGDVEKTGVYEVPFGVTLRELLEMAGPSTDSVTDSRIKTDKKIQAILFGGAAGAFATSEHLDVKMTFEDLRAAGLPLGSGVVMVFDETRDLCQFEFATN